MKPSDKLSNFREFLAEQMKDPEFAAAYAEESAKSDAEIAAYRRGLERAAEIAEQVIFDARTGDMDTDLRCVGSTIGYNIRREVESPAPHAAPQHTSPDADAREQRMSDEGITEEDVHETLYDHERRG